MLLVASYVFYGAWEWRYLALLFISTLTDYFCGLGVEKTEEKFKKKYFLYLSVFINLTLLGIFKYYDFFAENFQNLMNNFGIETHPYFLNVALPVGISFYTFQSISYTVDVYRGKLKACKNFLDFSLYVSFFPQLVAGPIERGTRLLPQILNARSISKENIIKGCYCIFWGLFLKVLIADNMADLVDPIYDLDNSTSGILTLLATYSFAIQIYCDFSGYSLIAIGLALLMGIELMENFRRPYFSLNISDFWRRWHISLSSWFRDYMFAPLYLFFQNSSFLRNKSIQTRHTIFFLLVLFATEFLLGLWHGAGWNYALFGVYHAFLIGGYYVSKKYWDKINKYLQIFLTFNLVCVGWLIFRSESLTQSLLLIKNILTDWSLSNELIPIYLKQFLILSSLLFVHEIVEEIKNKRYAILHAPKYIQYLIYTCMVVGMFLFGQFGERKFIYFQF
jgi:D-alanyl-lipoteichoic acid acyltransferase DltB (MBOAT superfamily)|tara:strand:- start:1479 stop:2825 length:1347 start_codon:yes stop_codon:yes gene_type:complete